MTAGATTRSPTASPSHHVNQMDPYSGQRANPASAMPAGAQTAVALALRKASRRPSLPATKYTAARPANSPRRLSWACGFILYKDEGSRGGVTPRLAGHPTRYTAAPAKGTAGVAPTHTAGRGGPSPRNAGKPRFLGRGPARAARRREPRRRGPREPAGRAPPPAPRP